jgi:cytochrome c-type biogenesis protein CcmH/NrfF
MNDTTAPDAASEPQILDDQVRSEVTAIRAQAQRYMVARYGKDVWYRAPETFGNMLERWIWAVASDVPAMAEESIAAIEQHFAEREPTR